MENDPYFVPPAIPMFGGATPVLTPPDTSVDPATDFYKYVNHPWQKHIHLLPYLGSYGVSEEIEEDVRQTLLKVIQENRRTNPSTPISMLAHSFLHTASQKNSIVDLQRILNTFDCIANVQDVGHSIGALNKIQARSPLSIVIAPDTMNSATCNIYLYEPLLGLPNHSYYTTNTRNHVLLKYSKLLEKVGNMMNIENLASAISIESALTQYLSTKDDAVSYIPYSYFMLKKRYKSIPWDDIFKGYGIDEPTYKKTTFIITNKAYTGALNRMFHVFSLEAWRTWMRSMTILSFMEYLPPPFDDLHFDLYGKTLHGISEKLPQKYLMLKVLSTFAKQDVSSIFVDLAVPSGTKEAMTHLVKQLKSATIQRLKKLDWMTEKTVSHAIQKVQKMGFQVAYPSVWESETSKVDIQPHRPLLNIINLAVQDTADMIRDLKHHTCKASSKKWKDGAFEVNAFYYPEGNTMVIPAGMCRIPFFDLKKSNAWNFGGIGVAIGHEITHGFDEDGRNYDADGNYYDWWTPHDTAVFHTLSKKVIDLFDGVPYMGGKVNGKLTLSENLADLGGLAIALEALNNELPNDPVAKKEAYIEFFTSYAVSWRTKDRPRKAKQALLLDSHAPAPLRVNLIVRQFQEFYDAFDILETHPMYIPHELRVKLW